MLCRYFNPRAPRGARHNRRYELLCYAAISIHVPREGHDFDGLTVPDGMDKFQSTCPARGTTGIEIEPLPLIRDFNPRAPRGARRGEQMGLSAGIVISIHVPREGHD